MKRGSINMNSRTLLAIGLIAALATTTPAGATTERTTERPASTERATPPAPAPAQADDRRDNSAANASNDHQRSAPSPGERREQVPPPAPPPAHQDRVQPDREVRNEPQTSTADQAYGYPSAPDVSGATVRCRPLSDKSLAAIMQRAFNRICRTQQPPELQPIGEQPPV